MSRPGNEIPARFHFIWGWASLFLVAVACFVNCPEARAHVPTIATFVLIEQGNAKTKGRWRLEVHMATSGMHSALSALYPEENLSEIKPQDYQTRLVDVLQDGIEIRYSNSTKPEELDLAGVDVGQHASVVTFTLAAPSTEAGDVRAHIEALNIVEGQQNVFRLVTSKSQGHVVLSGRNDFRGELSLRPAPSKPSQLNQSASDESLKGKHTHDGTSHSHNLADKEVRAHHKGSDHSDENASMLVAIAMLVASLTCGAVISYTRSRRGRSFTPSERG